MSGATKTDAKADVTSIRLQLHNAEQSRLIGSWLSAGLTNTSDSSPRPTGPNDDSDEEYDNKEFNFEQDEEGLGLGYVAPTTPNTPEDRHSMSTNDNLRKQLLGHSGSVHQRPLLTHGPVRLGHRGTSGNGNGNGPGKLQASKPKPQIRQGRSADDDDSGDDSDARTVATTKNTRNREERKKEEEEKKNKKSASRTAGAESVSSGISTDAGSTRSASHEPNSGKSDGIAHRTTTTSKRRSTNYLDEILAQRSNKRKKKASF